MEAIEINPQHIRQFLASAWMVNIICFIAVIFLSITVSWKPVAVAAPLYVLAGTTLAGWYSSFVNFSCVDWIMKIGLWPSYVATFWYGTRKYPTWYALTLWAHEAFQRGTYHQRITTP